MNEVEKLIAEQLVAKLTIANEAYRNGESVISDADYDDMEAQLRKIDPNNPYLTKLSGEATDGFAKAKHTMLMGSQAKCNTKEEIIAKLNHFTGKKVALLVEPKCDGISLEMNYVDGKAEIHITRGDGTIGDDVTANASKMMGVPAQLKDSFTGCVRGEILLLHSDKDKFYPDMKNCRNAASGICKRLDGQGSEHLTVITYDAQYADENQSFKTEANILDFLTANGFQRVNADMVVADCTSKAGIEKAADDLMEKMNEFTTADREYDTDGIVVKINIIDEHDKRTEVRPKTQWAIKPKATHRNTVLRNIEWNMTNGVLVPVAIFDPVEIDGATIQRATLCNPRYIEDLQIEIGDTLDVVRANMVIPRVMGDTTKGTRVTC